LTSLHVPAIVAVAGICAKFAEVSVERM